MAQGTQLLSSLCSICHTRPPMYTCPGCSTRTCCKDCYQTHKKRAQCSGEKPFEPKVTRTGMKFEAAFDKDYNFLSRLGRGIEVAHRDSEYRGIEKPQQSTGTKRDGPEKGEVPMKASLEADGIEIKRAPPGMSLSKANETTWRPSKGGGGINWTVMFYLRIWKFLDKTTSNQEKGLLDDERWPSRGTISCHEHNDIAQGFQSWLKHSSRIEKKRMMKIQDPPLTGEQKQEHRLWEEEEQLDKQPSGNLVDVLKRDNFRFYLEAPDKKKSNQDNQDAGKTALIPFDPSMRLKDILKGRTLEEFPHIWVWKNDPPPQKNFLIRADLTISPMDSERSKQEATRALTGSKRKSSEVHNIRRGHQEKRPRNEVSKSHAVSDLSLAKIQPGESEAADQARQQGACQQSQVEVTGSATAEEALREQPVRNFIETQAQSAPFTQQTLSGLGGLDGLSD